MRGAQLYLANVSWRTRDVVGDVIPGQIPVGTTFLQEIGRFEASVPAYARENGLDMQLAIRSDQPCYIIREGAPQIPLARYENPDTGDQWWIEKGEWRSKGKYHDAPSFRHPGGCVEIGIGDDICQVHLYDPSIGEGEFQSLLDDIKGWCWKMAIDESCYVTVESETEVKVLSADFLRFSEEFIRNVQEALRLPHCELRESVEYQRIERLKLNSHSIRFLAQRGERMLVPGRAALAHHDTPENRYLHGMLNAVQQMLRPQSTLQSGLSLRFSTTAKNYEDRALELRSKSTETIDPGVLNENIRRSFAGKALGFNKLKISNKKKPGDYQESWRDGDYDGTWVSVILPPKRVSPEIYELLERPSSVMIIGDLEFSEKTSSKGNLYWSCDIKRIDRVEYWRDYERECLTLVEQRSALELSNWERKLPKRVLDERLREASTLEKRAYALRSAASRTRADTASIQSLVDQARAAELRLHALGSKPDLRLVPTMVFLQSPSYSGALSSYRQLRDLTGVDDEGLESLLGLENVGLRDWPGVYERWCLVSLLKVLQDDFRFAFNQGEVRAKLLKYCTGSGSGHFSTQASRADINLELKIHYQPRFDSGRVPDFLVEIRDTNTDLSIRCVLDAKACNFKKRAANAKVNAWSYLDDCLKSLVLEKDYGESGKNYVFIMHASQGGVAGPTTTQAWANSSSYGGDAVYYWEVEEESGIVKPEHRHGAVMVRPYDSTHLKRLVLMLLQFGLGVLDICASCGAGGDDIQIDDTVMTAGGKKKYSCTCRKCGFLSIRTVCASCGNGIIKNQTSWSYHDLHPVDPWNIKCWSCGTLL